MLENLSAVLANGDVLTWDQNLRVARTFVRLNCVVVNANSMEFAVSCTYPRGVHAVVGQVQAKRHATTDH